MDANIFLQGNKQGNAAQERDQKDDRWSIIFQIWLWNSNWAWTKEFSKEEIREEKNKENGWCKQNVIIYACERNVKILILWICVL